MRKQFIVLTGMIIIIFAAASAFKRDIKQDGGFKNLKVLPKDISHDSLDAIMDYFKASLGVKCSFCHAPDPSSGRLNFASDDKPEKDIARMMMKMTVDINKNYFNFNSSALPDTIRVVNCYTCHNGNPHPEGTAPMDKDHQNVPPGAMLPPSQNGTPAPPPDHKQ